jgi:hypothetical protein
VTRLNRVKDVGYININKVYKKKILTRLNRIKDVGLIDINEVCKKKILTRLHHIKDFEGTRSLTMLVYFLYGGWTRAVTKVSYIKFFAAKIIEVHHIKGG